MSRTGSTFFVRALEELFRWRRDVRQFRPEPVPEDVLQAVLAAGADAPSVGLSEPWRIIRVESAEPRAAVRRSFAACNARALEGYAGERAELYASLKLAGLDRAPVHLAVYSDHADVKGHGLGQVTMPETRDYSAVCAVMLMWLAARARGVGMGWVSILDREEVAQALEVPADWRLIAYLCVGWPVEETARAELEKAGWERRVGLEGRILRR
jgi:5,6-dimethylbenzimidazole synthase